jgi:hypothetical protein
MGKNITFIGMDDDDDKTIFQTEEDRTGNCRAYR